MLLASVDDRTHAALDHGVLLEEAAAEAGEVAGGHKGSVLTPGIHPIAPDAGVVAGVRCVLIYLHGDLLGRLRAVRRVSEVSEEEDVVGVVHRREDEQRTRTRERSANGGDRHQRHQVFGDPDVGVAIGSVAQSGRPHAVGRGLRLVLRRLVEGHREVGMLGHLGRLGDPGLVEDPDVGGVDRALDSLKPVAGNPRHAPIAVQVLVTEGQLGERWGLAAAQPHPCEAPALMHREVDDRHTRCELLGPDRLVRTLDDAAGHVHLPPVVDASKAVALGPGEQERGPPVGAKLVEEPDAAVLGAEGDVVLPEEPDRHGSLAVHQERRHRERDPVVRPHEPTHGGVALDQGHQLVLSQGGHGVSFEPGLREEAR